MGVGGSHIHVPPMDRAMHPPMAPLITVSERLYSTPMVFQLLQDCISQHALTAEGFQGMLVVVVLLQVEDPCSILSDS